MKKAIKLLSYEDKNIESHHVRIYKYIYNGLIGEFQVHNLREKLTKQEEKILLRDIKYHLERGIEEEESRQERILMYKM